MLCAETPKSPLCSWLHSFLGLKECIPFYISALSHFVLFFFFPSIWLICLGFSKFSNLSSIVITIFSAALHLLYNGFLLQLVLHTQQCLN